MPHLVLLRPAQPFEIERIREIERLAATRLLGTDLAHLAEDEPTDAAVLLERLKSDGLIVAAEAGQPVGYVVFRETEGCAYVEQVDVLPSHAGRRIGARLLDAVAERAAARGLAALTLSTFRDVPFNAPYYRRLGFVALADADLTPGLQTIREEHLARGLDESRRVFMRRPIRDLRPPEPGPGR
jgi:predicted N-acetyltransferase YhbS